ncbi:MAG: TSUP family transporter [Clostridia bacterium]|nr:TSUP family transporter [Clostridia bacterium]
MLDFIFGTAAAVFSGLGVGSGGLLVIYLTMVGEYEQITAQGLNLLFFLFSSGTAMLYHLTHRQINYGAVMMLVAFGLAGAAAGSFLLGVLGGNIVRKIFGGMLIFSGVLALKKAHAKRTSDINIEPSAE